MLRKTIVRPSIRRLRLSAAPRLAPITVRALATTSRMARSLASNPFASTAPADSFQLLPEAQKAGEAEDQLYDAQVKEVEAWWSTPRFAGIVRPYTADDVVSKRGSQQIAYPSSVMATKLFNLVRERVSKGEPIHTSECYLCTAVKASQPNSF